MYKALYWLYVLERYRNENFLHNFITNEIHILKVYFFLCLETHPKKLHLQQALAPIKYKWREIGEGLEISYGAIKSINRNPQYDDDTLKLSEILQTWIDTNDPSNVTWGAIIEVIKKDPVNEPALAETILKSKYVK